jgi:plastocyanin
MIYTVAENHGSNCKLSSGLITCKEFTTPSTSNSTLYAIDASTGQVAWSFNEDGYGTGASSTNSLVFTSDANHHFYAFNGFSGGSPLWNYTDNGGGKTWSWGPPAVTDGMVFESTFGNTTSGYLEAFTASVIRSTLVTVQNNAYNPNPVVVVVGVNNTVTWVNYDSVAHTVTADDGSFDSGLIQPGGSYTHTFTTPGTYEYNSTVQPGMTGKLEVEALVTSTTSTTTSSPTSSGFVFSVKVTDAGVPYLGAWVSINEGTTTVASGYTDSNGIFQANLPQGTYSATACETSQCVVFVGGVFPADSQGGSITLDFTSATTVSSTSTSTSTTIITTQTSSSTQSQTQTSSQTSSTVTTSSYSITTSSSSSSVSGTSSSSIYLYAGLGIVAVGVVVLVALLLTRSRRGK